MVKLSYGKNELDLFLVKEPQAEYIVNEMGAALMKQDKTVSNRGVQHYQHRFNTTSRQDNPVGKGYLT